MSSALQGMSKSDRADPAKVLDRLLGPTPTGRAGTIEKVALAAGILLSLGVMVGACVLGTTPTFLASAGASVNLMGLQTVALLCGVGSLLAAAGFSYLFMRHFTPCAAPVNQPIPKAIP